MDSIARLWRCATALALICSASPALARDVDGGVADAATTLKPGGFVWSTGDPGQGPVSITISIADQRGYVYRGNALVAVTTVSTGSPGHDTPVGSFKILQKAVTHHSNKYDNAPMPYMQRITWDGVAIHGGQNPGYPASHGCIRVPIAFAKRLYGETKLGGVVTVTDMPADTGVAAPPTGVDDQTPAVLPPDPSPVG